MELVRMPIADLRASSLNPRTSFTGIEELADSFELNPNNPGEPITPIIAVRDANVARVVDGERRLRAMRKRKRVKECWVMLCDDMADADAALAMLAVNTRENLTDAEVGRGFQQAMLLGVPEETIDKMAGRPVSAALKRHAQARGKVETISLDQLLAADEFADDPEAYADVLDADNWGWVARQRQDARERAEEEANLAAAIEEARAKGLDVRDKRPKGSICERTLYLSTAAETIREDCQEWVCEGYVLVLSPKSWAPCELYSMAQSDGDEATVATKSGMRRAMQHARKRRVEFIVGRLVASGTAQLANVSALVAAYVRDIALYKLEELCKRAGVDASNIPVVANEFVIASYWGEFDHMTNDEVDGMIDGRAYGCAYRRQCDILAALERDGYEPEQEERDLVELCEATAAKLEADA